MSKKQRRHGHIRLLTHPSKNGPKPLPIKWGAATPEERGPLIATLTTPSHRNVIGTHAGSYAVYRALAVAAKALDPAALAALYDGQAAARAADYIEGLAVRLWAD